MDLKLVKTSASENDEALKIEKEDNLYKIYRKGEDERIEITLLYLIEDGVEVFQDNFIGPFLIAKMNPPTVIYY